MTRNWFIASVWVLIMHNVYLGEMLRQIAISMLGKTDIKTSGIEYRTAK